MRRTLVILIMLFSFYGCAYNNPPELEGLYQSEHIGNYMVQITVNKTEKTFTQFIDNREVNSGSVSQVEDEFLLDGNLIDYTITLSEEDSFEILVPSISGEKPILLKNVGKVPTYFKTEFEDVVEYQELLQ